MQKPQVVSTRWTLLLKLLLPTVWICFFGGAAVLLLFTDLSQIREPFSPMSARLMVLSFAVSSIGILYLLFMRIKWAALSDTHLYVSNFFRSYRYTFDSIQSIEETRVLFWRRITIRFHQPTKFGQTIFFIKSYYWDFFLQKHPEILEQLPKP